LPCTLEAIVRDTYNPRCLSTTSRSAPAPPAPAPKLSTILSGGSSADLQNAAACRDRLPTVRDSYVRNNRVLTGCDSLIEMARRDCTPLSLSLSWRGDSALEIRSPATFRREGQSGSRDHVLPEWMIRAWTIPSARNRTLAF